jgi:exosortase C (VPDSG-CTERM-specific)
VVDCTQGKSESAVSATQEPSFRRNPRPPQKRLFGYLGFVVILGLVYAKPLIALAFYAAGTDLHSHILLIPLISVCLIFVQRRQLPREYSTSLRYALLPFVPGLVALIAAWGALKADPPLSQNDYLSLTAFGFVCFLATGGFVFLGRRWMASAAFPMAFLVFMAPLPDRLLHFLETASQVASTEAAAMFFTITGVPMLRNGAVFQLPGIAIEVAQECSGIRSSYVLFITTLVASYLFLKSPWRRAILIALVIPLAIVRNGFRIWVIGLLCVEIGPHLIHSVIHRQGGPLFFALSLIPLFLLLWWLRKGENAKAGPQMTQINTDGREAKRAET